MLNSSLTFFRWYGESASSLYDERASFTYSERASSLNDKKA